MGCTCTCPYVANKGRSGLHLDKFHGEESKSGGGAHLHVYHSVLILVDIFGDIFSEGGPKIVARGSGGQMIPLPTK